MKSCSHKHLACFLGLPTSCSNSRLAMCYAVCCFSKCAHDPGPHCDAGSNLCRVAVKQLNQETNQVLGRWNACFHALRLRLFDHTTSTKTIAPI